jgi:hypothetical protein
MLLITSSWLVKAVADNECIDNANDLLKLGREKKYP